MRRRRILKITSTALALAMLCCLLSGAARGSSKKSKTAEEFSPCRIYYDGLLGGIGQHNGSFLYLPLEDTCLFFGFEISTITEENGYTAVGDELIISQTADSGYLTANYRYVYCPGNYRIIHEEVYLQAEALCDILGLEISISSDLKQADIDSSGFVLLTGSATYYEDNYSNDDIFWLSNIIHSECGHQSLENMIGVGNVIMNRVASSRYPDTIYDVIFDDEFTVQFSPAYSGSIYNQPGELALAATYLTLEGYNTVGDSMYFVNPYGAQGDSYDWFKYGLKFVIKIDDHEFYTLKNGDGLEDGNDS